MHRKQDIYVHTCMFISLLAFYMMQQQQQYHQYSEGDLEDTGTRTRKSCQANGLIVKVQ